MVRRLTAALAAAAMLVLTTVTPAAATQNEKVFSYYTQTGAKQKIMNPVEGKCYPLKVKARGDLILSVKNSTYLKAVVSTKSDCAAGGEVQFLGHGETKAKIGLAASVHFRQG